MKISIRPGLLGALVLGLVALASAASAQALKLPSIISDHMVLQAGQPVPVWGWARPGERVTVRFAGQTRRAVAGIGDGRWEVRLASLAATNRPEELTISTSEKRVIADVIVGEVWLGSGQSNMEKPLGDQRGQAPTLNYQEELAKADLPDIRMFKAARIRSATPQKDVAGQWVKVSPTTVDAIKFSAAAFYFGRKLHEDLKVPVGLIDASWGGTRIELWTPAEDYLAVPSLAAFADYVRTSPAKPPALQLSTLYNGMIAPLTTYAIKGVIWYQGESNVIDYQDGAIYADKMEALIGGWRKAFGRELSFYSVQIAPHTYHIVRQNMVVSPEATPEFWEAQTASMRIPKTGMVVTTDLVDDLADIHPRNKLDVGERLARWALARDYGRTDVVVSGPMLRSMTVSGGKAVLSFDHLGGGLVVKGAQPLNWFTIAGRDGKVYPGTAVIEGDTVVVSSGYVPEPAVVRFAWDEAARPNFFNKAGLPAVPFRTDSPFIR